MKYIDAEKLKDEIDKIIDDAPSYDDSKAYLLKVCSIIDSLQQEQQETPVIEVIARCVYESWMGGTMNDVRRHMNELGRVLNARKEE